jgi:hypothetical protein
MKTDSFRPFLATFALTGGLLLVHSARAAVVPTINSPGSSYASIWFDDTASFDPLLTPGVTSLNQNVSPWGGAAPINNNLSLTTDPITFDFAQGDITADVIGGNYSIALNNIVLNQLPGNTGLAHLLYQFSVEYQLDAFGLPSQATVFPTFLVNGTVQPSAGSFAAIKGYIDYLGVNTAGTIGVLETVNYNSLFTTPGNFSAIVSGVPVNGSTPTLVGGTTLTLVGYLDFIVDPASISVQTVPEPGSALLAGFAALGGLLWRRAARPVAHS